MIPLLPPLRATICNYLLVNPWRAALARALSPDAVERLFVRLSDKAVPP